MLKMITQLNPQFTKEDRDACVPIVEKMVALNNFVRNEGALALKSVDEDNPFLREAMRIVYDAICYGEEAEKMMSDMITADNCAGADLLGRLIMAKGILMILDGKPLQSVRETLLSMLGEDYMGKNAPDFSGINKFLFFAERPGKDGLADNEWYSLRDIEDEIYKLINASIRKILTEVSDGDILGTLPYASYGTISKLLNNIPSERAERIISLYETYTPSADALRESGINLSGKISLMKQSGDSVCKK
jgi:hypothetical protein